MKKVIAFDLDDTLSLSKTQAEDRMVELLNQLLEKYQVCVISGGKLEQFQKQIPFIDATKDGYNLSNLHLMPTCGTRYHRFNRDNEEWEQVYAEDFSESEKKKIIKALSEGIDETGFRSKKLWGEMIEDRGSQITLSVLGQEAPVEAKAAWDPEDVKKYKLREAIAGRLPDFEVRAGGMTSIDVTKQGIDKAYGMKKLMDILNITKNEILFMGDKMHEGGNDYPIKIMGIDSIAVRDWKDTALAIETILKLTS
ncbi:MAG TPA: HAD-IIB family hydrolase [Candidatus Saccharimonadales bacterium]|nr:HAD-IIB family hydrolase [Candidatus Saccharimonadales bacterium]